MQWFIVIALILIVVQAMLYNKWGLTGISYQRRISNHAVFEGDSIEMIEQIRNAKLLPAPWIRIESTLPASLKFTEDEDLDISEGTFVANHRSVFSLWGYTQVTRRHRAVCGKRGYYQLRSASLTAGDLFYMTARHRVFPVYADYVVYPKLLEPSAMPESLRSLQGELRVRRWIAHDPFLTQGTRDYQAGDSLRQVHWKATARLQRLQVHKHEFTANRKLLIMLDLEAPHQMRLSVRIQLQELALSYAATLVSDAIQNGLESGFVSTGSLEGSGDRTEAIVWPSGGDQHLSSILDCMGRLRLDRQGCAFSQLIEQTKQHSAADILLISCMPEAFYASTIYELREAGHHVTCYPLAEEGVL